MVVVVVGAALVLSRGSARADYPLGDNRPQDRFYFGIHAGVGSRTTESVSSPAADPGVAWGYEVSYWPIDYFALGYGLNAGVFPGGDTGEAGAYALLAIPLRYLQPYVGGWAGVAYSGSLDTEADSFDVTAHLVAGTNLYVNRNVRLFLQWQNLRVDADAETRTQLLTLGVRFSPDDFHELRGADKFTVVWGCAAATVPVFLLTVLFLSIGDQHP